MLPEAVNFLLSEDEGILEMINEVANFTLTSYPGENIRTALKSLADGLRDRSLKVLLCYFVQWDIDFLFTCPN